MAAMKPRTGDGPLEVTRKVVASCCACPSRAVAAWSSRWRRAKRPRWARLSRTAPASVDTSGDCVSKNADEPRPDAGRGSLLFSW